MTKKNGAILVIALFVIMVSTISLSGCVKFGKWRIYALDLETGKVELIYAPSKRYQLYDSGFHDADIY